MEPFDALRAVAAGAAGVPELDRLLEDALDTTLTATGFEAGLVLLANRHTEEDTLAASRGISQETAARLGCVSAADRPLLDVLESGTATMLPDVSSQLAALRDERLDAGLLAPLRAGDASRGVLIVAARDGRDLSAADLDLVRAIGDQLGVAVENASFRREADRRLRIQTHLNELAERIVSKFETETIMETVLRSAPELTGADGAGIALGDREGEWGRCTVGFPRYPSGPIRVERVVDHEVMRTRRPVVVADYPASPHAVPALVDAGLADLVAVPIVYGEHVFGALTLFHVGRCRGFSDSDLAVAVELGRQTGIAVENAQLHESTRFYVRQVTRAQEDERKRIARELHDETIQSLVVVSRSLESLSVFSDQLPEAAQERIASLQVLLTETMKGVRRFVQDLRPPMLDHLGLVASVEALASDLRENHAIEAVVRVVGTPRRLEPEEELVLYRIVQEAMGNTRRHSRASRVEVHMEFAVDRVTVCVSDDGCGFAVPKRIDAYVSEEKLGLIGMKERARTLGGTLDIRSEPGLGTRVTAEIPSERPPEPDPGTHATAAIPSQRPPTAGPETDATAAIPPKRPPTPGSGRPVGETPAPAQP